MSEIVLFFTTGLISILSFLFLFLLLKPNYYPFRNTDEDVSRWKIFGVYCLIWVIYFFLIIALTPENFATQQATNSAEQDPSMWGFLFGLVLGIISFVWVIKHNNTYDKKQLPKRENKQQENIFQQPPSVPKYDEPLKVVETAPIQHQSKSNTTSTQYGDYSIVYEKENGEVSTRFIDITLIYNQSKRWYIDAYCYQAYAERTFRADRILELSNHKTGEHLTNQTAIRAYIRDLAKNGGY